MDYTSLQQTFTDNLTSGVTSGVQDQLGKIMAWVVIPSIILTVIILLAYILHLIHRHKVDKAIFEIRDMLREMKSAGTFPATAATATESVDSQQNEPSTLSDKE